jgi:hypothetical protein
MESKLKDIENQILNFVIDQVNLDVVIKIKELSENIKKIEKNIMWEYFQPDLDSLPLDDFDIILDPSMYKKEYPITIIKMIKEAICSTCRMLSDQNKIKSYKDFNVELSKLYIKHEDYQDYIEDETYYLYDLIDDKFKYLDDNQEFIKISDLLDKIAKEICQNVSNHVESKRKFYEEYFKENFSNIANKSMSTNSELFVDNFIKNYILRNFGIIFNQVCLDILELNGIKEPTDIKKIVGLYYDYTKQTTKFMLSLNDIDKRIKMWENLAGDKIDNKIKIYQDGQ